MSTNAPTTLEETTLGGLYNPPHAPGWKPTSLYTIADWINGLAFKDAHFSATGKPVVKIAEIKNGITSQTQFTEGEYDSKVHIKAGDTLFAWSGQPETSIGVSIWRGQDGWLNQHIFKVLPHEGIDKDFLYFFLTSLNPYFVRIAKNKQTTGLGHITKEDLRAMQVGIPSLDVQRELARVVLPLEQKIELLQRQNETLEQVAQAMFKEWFVGFNFPNAEGKPYKASGGKMIQSELGEIPEGWSIDSLGDVVSHLKDTVSPTIKSSELFTHYSIPGFDTNKTPVVEKGGGILSNKYRVVEGSLLFSKLNPDVPRIWAIFTPERNAVCSTEFQVLKPTKKRYFSLVYSLLRFSEFARQLASKAQGTSSSHQRLKSGDILGTRFPKPKESVLQDYHALIYPLLTKIDRNEKQARELAALRDLLLPKLMRGEIRVLN